MAVDLLGRFLFTANTGEDTVSAFRIAQNGVLAKVAGSPFKAGAMPVSVGVDPLDRSVYVANMGDHFDFETSTVSGFRIAPNGALAEVPGSPFAGGFVPFAVAVDPLGRFLYVANSGGNTSANENVSGYRIAGKGALKPLAKSPFPNGQGPEAAAIDPFGRFLYVSDFFANFSAYRIAPNGTLQPLAGFSAHAGPSSSAVTADPFGRFFYVANDDSISGYRVGDGVLAGLGGFFTLSRSTRAVPWGLISWADLPYVAELFAIMFTAVVNQANKRVSLATASL